MTDEEYRIQLNNILATVGGRCFIYTLLTKCGVDIVNGISYRPDITAHEVGLDLLHQIMYNNSEVLNKIISEQKTLEVNNGRGSRGSDD